MRAILALSALLLLCSCTTTRTHYVNGSITFDGTETSLWFNRTTTCDVVQGKCTQATTDTSGGPTAVAAMIHQLVVDGVIKAQQ